MPVQVFCPGNEGAGLFLIDDAVLFCLPEVLDEEAEGLTGIEGLFVKGVFIGLVGGFELEAKVAHDAFEEVENELVMAACG